MTKTTKTNKQDKVEIPSYLVANATATDVLTAIPEKERGNLFGEFGFMPDELTEWAKNIALELEAKRVLLRERAIEEIGKGNDLEAIALLQEASEIEPTKQKVGSITVSKHVTQNVIASIKIGNSKNYSSRADMGCGGARPKHPGAPVWEIVSLTDADGSRLNGRPDDYNGTKAVQSVVLKNRTTGIEHVLTRDNVKTLTFNGKTLTKATTTNAAEVQLTFVGHLLNEFGCQCYIDHIESNANNAQGANAGGALRGQWRKIVSLFGTTKTNEL